MFSKKVAATIERMRRKEPIELVVLHVERSVADAYRSDGPRWRVRMAADVRALVRRGRWKRPRKSG